MKKLVPLPLRPCRKKVFHLPPPAHTCGRFARWLARIQPKLKTALRQLPTLLETLPAKGRRIRTPTWRLCPDDSRHPSYPATLRVPQRSGARLAQLGAGRPADTALRWRPTAPSAHKQRSSCPARRLEANATGAWKLCTCTQLPLPNYGGAGTAGRTHTNVLPDWPRWPATAQCHAAVR